MTHPNEPTLPPAQPVKPPPGAPAPQRRGGAASFGELHPVGGGDPIPLLKPTLVIGRRESCDIVLRFANVSGAHCELSLVAGYWVVRDLGSSNGTKVNGDRVNEGRLEPGARLSIARHEYEVNYDPGTIAGAGAAAYPGPQRDIFSRSLLQSAGLEGRRSRP